MTGVPFRHTRDFLRFYGPWRAIRFVRSGSPDSGVGGGSPKPARLRERSSRKGSTRRKDRGVLLPGGEDFSVSYVWPGIRLFLL